MLFIIYFATSKFEFPDFRFLEFENSGIEIAVGIEVRNVGNKPENW
jgi:hypothetical protein